MKRPHYQKARQKKSHSTLRIGDTVQVISGKDKGAVGKVLEIDWKRERILIEGVNKVSRHVKPGPRQQQGGIISSEAAIHYSNVLLYNSALGRGVRVRIQRTEAGIKQRICVKTGTVIE